MPDQAIECERCGAPSAKPRKRLDPWGSRRSRTCYGNSTGLAHGSLLMPNNPQDIIREAATLLGDLANEAAADQVPQLAYRIRKHRDRLRSLLSPDCVLVGLSREQARLAAEDLEHPNDLVSMEQERLRSEAAAAIRKQLEQ